MQLAILDDDARFAKFLARVASGLDLEVATSTTIDDFHRRFYLTRPDIVFLDLHLGASDGIEQLRFLSAEHFDGSIVLISGSDQRILAAAQRLGSSVGLSVAAVLPKPARTADVRGILQQLLGSRDALTDADLETAIEQDELTLYLQPIVDSHTLALRRLEALCRWKHPSRGMVMPDQFIALAERDHGLMDRLTMWVVERALEQHLALRKLGTVVPIAVNLSGVSIRRLDFPDRLEALARSVGAPPEALTFEVTESAATGAFTETIDILTRMRLKGFEIAIDDFGTGYSSLKALRYLPWSELKIDKSFVADLPHSRDALVIVKSTIALAKNMELQCVAEGVESREVAMQLAALGVDLLQGYFVGKPMPFERLTEWLEAWTGGHVAGRAAE